MSILDPDTYIQFTAYYVNGEAGLLVMEDTLYEVYLKYEEKHREAFLLDLWRRMDDLKPIIEFKSSSSSEALNVFTIQFKDDYEREFADNGANWEEDLNIWIDDGKTRKGYDTLRQLKSNCAYRKNIEKLNG